MSEVFVSVSVAIRLIGSHGVNVPGYQFSRHGGFAAFSENGADVRETFSFSDITVLDLKLDTFLVGPPSKHEPQGWQALTVHFKEPQISTAIEKFLRDLATALTASFASRQRDPWNGNLVVDIDWSGVRLNRPPAAASIEPYAFTRITSKESRLLTAQQLESLGTSYLTEIFVEGMRAAQPKAKYSNWFIPIEELERLATSKFSSLFTPLFTAAEQERIVKESRLAGSQLDQLKRFLRSPTNTVQSRAEKLYAILIKIGLIEFEVLENKKVNVDLCMCKTLINTRNSLAHKGSKIDEDLLYNVLFPLSFIVVKYLSTG